MGSIKECHFQINMNNNNNTDRRANRTEKKKETHREEHTERLLLPQGDFPKLLFLLPLHWLHTLNKLKTESRNDFFH